MSLDSFRDGNILWTEMNNYLSKNSNAGSYFLSVIERVIDNGFQQAKPNADNIDITPPAGSFKLLYQNIGKSNMPKLIGEECARYWSEAIAPGTPVSCSTIVSVENDASKIAGPIESNIRSLFKNDYLIPYYVDFINAIYSEVLTINWTVVESDSNCNATHIVNVT